jgi:hypothetical protein
MEALDQGRVGGRQHLDQVALFQLQPLDFRLQGLVVVFQLLTLLLKIFSPNKNWEKNDNFVLKILIFYKFN